MSIRILKKKWLYSLQKEHDLRLIGFFEQIQSAINYVERLDPDLIIINLSLPLLSGINPTQIIGQFGVDRQIIFLTSKDNRREFKQIWQGGARAYLLDTSSISEIIKVIRLVNQGYFYLDPQLTQRYIFQTSETQRKSTSKKTNLITNLSDKERFLLELQSLHHDSKYIKSILKKLISRLYLVPNILVIVILMIVVLILVIIISL